MMTAKIKVSNRILSFLLSIALLVTCLPIVLAADGVSEDVYKRISDISTIDQWKDYFPIGDNLTTQNAGGVWSDKSVFTTDTNIDGNDFTIGGKNNFLVALSAIGSNMTVTGQAAVPTDTVIVLDTSGSMSGSPAVAMVEAVNIAINELMEANPKNRIAIIFFANNRTTFLPLNSYKTTDRQGRFLNINTRGTSISLNEAVTDANGSRVYASRDSWPVNDGTYTAGGLKYAMNVLTSASNANSLNQNTSPRIPAVMLFTDGIPTRAANTFTNPPENADNSGIGNGKTSSAGEAEVFATELTAAYVKAKITETYGKEYPCLFYTLGMEGTERNSLRECVLDPENENTANLKRHWQNYNALDTNDRITVDGESFQKIGTTLSPNYVDGYFDVDSYKTGNTTLDEALAQAFKEVVADIVSKSVYTPTLVQGTDGNLSGYISFVDKIGSYMKASEIKGIMSGGTLFTGAKLAETFYNTFTNGSGDLGTGLGGGTEIGVAFLESIATRLGIDKQVAFAVLQNAWQKGQISYDPTSGAHSNWFGWLSDTNGAYIGVWYEGMTLPVNTAYINRSYIFLGKDGDTDMMHTTVRVREKVVNAVPTGEQEVNFAVPASLLPTITYNVDLNADKSVKAITVTPDTPIHLVYEVGLDPEINEFNIKDKVSAAYLEANTDKQTGEVYFYTNEWERAADENGSLTGYGKVNTYSYFRPSRQNDRYYYQNDSFVYSDKNGTKYTSSTRPADANEELYYHYYYYKKEGTSLSTVYEYHAVPKNVLSVAYGNIDHNWTIMAGTVRSDYSGSTANVISKTDNASGTLGFSHEPFADTNSYAWNDTTHSSVVGVTLANNGRLSMVPETGIRLSKALSPDVALAEGEAAPVFTFDVVYEGQNGDLNAYAYRFDDNGVLVGGMEQVEFKNGKAEVTLTAGETLYIGGMTSGKVKVTERDNSLTYTLDSVSVMGQPAVGSYAEVDLATGDMKDISFINTLRGTGTFTVGKEVTHDFGAGYTVPNNANTSFKVEMTFTFNGEPLSGTYKADITGGEQYDFVLHGAENETVAIYLSHKEQFTVYGLPEGTVVTATEELTDAQRASFTASYWENISEVTISNNTVSQVLILNDYTAQGVTPKVAVSGVKKLINKVYAGDFTFYLQEYKGTGSYNDSASWTTLETQKVSYDHSNGDEAFAFAYDFTGKTYDKIGTYIYRVHEDKTPIEGVIYDARIHTFQIDVTDNDMDGYLEARVSTTRAPQVNVTASGNNGTVAVAFENEYTEDNFVTVDIDVQKLATNLSGSPLGSVLSDFTFGLYDTEGNLIETLKTNSAGAARFSKTYRANVAGDVGEHVYILKEIPDSPKKAGWEYTDKEVKITVKVQGENQLEAVITTDDNTATVNGNDVDVTFTNTYKVTEATLDIDFVSKQIASNVGLRPLKDGEFKFAVYQVIDGVRSETPVATGTNDEFGTVTFDKALTYTEFGGPYFYDIVEVKPENAPAYIGYDSSVYKMTVRITDEGGKLVATPVVESVAGNLVVFANTYTASPVDVVIEGTKTIEGRPLTENDFQFILSEVGTSNVWYASNNEAGGYTSTFSFPKLTFSYEGEYTFEVSEYDPTAVGTYYDGVTYDDRVYTVTVNVSDNGDGTLGYTLSYAVGNDAATAVEFENSYAPDKVSLDIVGAKTLNGRDLREGEFTFDMYDADFDGTAWTRLETVAGTAKNTADGVIAFPALTYDKVGTEHYIIVERETDANGVTYDATEWYATVKISDNGNGLLYVESVIYETEDGRQSGMVFVNTYAAEEGTFSLSGLKELTGRDLAPGEFSFTLYESDEDRREGSIIQTVVNDENGVFVFDDIVYEEVGVYFFLVKEEKGNLTGVTYDERVYLVKVDVTDDGEGKLEVEYTVLDENDAQCDEVLFENSFTAPPVNPPTSDSLVKWLAPIAVSGAVITFIAMKKKKEDDGE